MTEAVQVAVGVIFNSNNQVLISKRASTALQANYWEFPGGKVESNETLKRALARELKEELGINILECKFLLSVPFDYGDIKVRLHTYTIKKYSGDAKGLEGQPVKWVHIDELEGYDFPPANIAIIKALKLPDVIQITGHFSSLKELLVKAKACIDKGVCLIQFRAHDLSDDVYMNYAAELLKVCRLHKVKLILNRTADILDEIDADGVHLNRFELLKYKQRPCADDKYLSVSCHNADELKQAENISADFCLLSPVKPAQSHDAGAALGTRIFSELTALSPMPVYALGGMHEADLVEIKQLGGTGIATISANW